MLHLVLSLLDLSDAFLNNIPHLSLHISLSPSLLFRHSSCLTACRTTADAGSYRRR